MYAAAANRVDTAKVRLALNNCARLHFEMLTVYLQFLLQNGARIDAARPDGRHAV